MQAADASTKQSGTLVPTEEECFALYGHAFEYLTGNGYIPYSSRHFCLPHHGHLFELMRMEGEEYIGLGVGAQSLNNGYFYRNTNNIRLYLQNAGDYEKTTVRVYEATTDLLMQDYLSQRLRSVSGFSRYTFESKFSVPVPDPLARKLDGLVQNGLLTEEKDRFLPTRRGLFLQQ